MSSLAASGEAFRRVFGRPPEGIWSAPGRVNLIGEFTDYNDGFVLPLALPFAAQACAARRDDGVVRIASAQRSQDGELSVVEAALSLLRPGTASGWASYVLGVVWALREAGMEMDGVELLIDSDVPIGAGLSSSAALECSVVLALHDLYELQLSRQDLALVAQRAENEYVGVPTGIMDQTASLLCRSGHALFLDTRTFDVRQVPLDLKPVGLTLLVVNTGVKHALGTLPMQIASATAVEPPRSSASPRCATSRQSTSMPLSAQIADDVVRRRARHVISEQSRVLEVVRLLESGRPAEVGPVLSAGHRSLRDDYEVSCAELDTVVGVAVANGALGARMTGGGFGGSAVVLVELAKAEAVTAAVAKAFVARGYSPPQTFEIVACSGASRLS